MGPPMPGRCQVSNPLTIGVPKRNPQNLKTFVLLKYVSFVSLHVSLIRILELGIRAIRATQDGESLEGSPVWGCRFRRRRGLVGRPTTSSHSKVQSNLSYHCL